MIKKVVKKRPAKDEHIHINVQGTATRAEIIKDLRMVISVLQKSPSDEISLGWDYSSILVSLEPF